MGSHSLWSACNSLPLLCRPRARRRTWRSEQFDAAPGHQNFILVELHGIAHVDVEQVVAGEAGGDQGRSPRRISVVSRVLDLHLEQVVAGGGSVVHAEVALPEGVQQ